jgi:hypothetical protein
MNTSHFAALRRSLLGAASRRDVLGALGGGLLAAGPLVHLVDYSEARRKRKARGRAARKSARTTKGIGPSPAPTPPVLGSAPILLLMLPETYVSRRRSARKSPASCSAWSSRSRATVKRRMPLSFASPLWTTRASRRTRCWPSRRFPAPAYLMSRTRSLSPSTIPPRSRLAPNTPWF